MKDVMFVSPSHLRTAPVLSLINNIWGAWPQLVRMLSDLSIIWENQSVVNRLSEVWSFYFLEAFFHQRSNDVDMLSLSVSLEPETDSVT